MSDKSIGIVLNPLSFILNNLFFSRNTDSILKWFCLYYFYLFIYLLHFLNCYMKNNKVIIQRVKSQQAGVCLLCRFLLFFSYQT